MSTTTHQAEARCADHLDMIQPTHHYTTAQLARTPDNLRRDLTALGALIRDHAATLMACADDRHAVVLTANALANLADALKPGPRQN